MLNASVALRPLSGWLLASVLRSLAGRTLCRADSGPCRLSVYRVTSFCSSFMDIDAARAKAETLKFHLPAVFCKKHASKTTTSARVTMAVQFF